MIRLHRVEWCGREARRERLGVSNLGHGDKIGKKKERLHTLREGRGRLGRDTLEKTVASSELVVIGGARRATTTRKSGGRNRI